MREGNEKLIHMRPNMPVQPLTVDRKIITDVMQCDLASSDQQYTSIFSSSQLVTAFYLFLFSPARST
jgi:hypothetical protein